MNHLSTVAGRTFRSLRVRNYRLYYLGQIVSLTGTWMQSIAQMWLVLELTGSAVALGITTALQFGPMLVLGPWGGVIADRFDKRRLLIATQSAAALLALGLAIATATGAATVSMIYAFAFAWGCVIMIDNPTRQSFVIELVGADDLANAIGLNSTIVTGARTLGPAIAGVLIAVFGAALCFFLNAASYIAVIVGLALMNPADLHRRPPVPRARGQLREGLRYVANEPVLRSTLLLLAVIGTLAFNFRLFLPLMADAFNSGPGGFGALSAVMGLGTIIGALAAAGRAEPTRKLLLGSGLAFGALILVVAAMPNLPLAMAALLPMGAASVVFAATANTTLQLAASAEMRGRVMALYAVAFIGSAPVGGPLIGWIAQAFGVRASLVFAGSATVLAALYSLRTRLRAQTAATARVLAGAVASAARLTTPVFYRDEDDSGQEREGQLDSSRPGPGLRFRPPAGRGNRRRPERKARAPASDVCEVLESEKQARQGRREPA